MSNNLSPTASQCRPLQVSSPRFTIARHLLGRPLRQLLLAGLLGLMGVTTWAVQDPNFTVGVNNTPLSPTSIKPGEPTSLRITLKNISAVAYTGASFSNVLPSGGTGNLVVRTGAVSVTTDPATTGSCSGATVTTTPGSPNIQLSGLTIPAQVGANPGICYIDIPITAKSVDGSSTSYSYAFAVGDVTLTGGDTNGGGGSQAFAITGVSRPTWAKKFLNDPSLAVLGGANDTLRLTVSNPAGGVPLTGVAFDDIFPTAGGGAIIEPVAPSTVSAGCGGPPVVALRAR